MRYRLKCIIVKHHSCNHHDKEHEDDEDMVVESRIATPHSEHRVKFDLPYEQTANALMSAKGYSEYDFTDALLVKPQVLTGKNLFDYARTH